MPFRSNLKLICDGGFQGSQRHLGGDEEPGNDNKAKTPLCPNCRVPTIWYQSKLERQNGSQKIVRSFYCPNCALVVQTEEPEKQGLRLVQD